jgi:hypothetical protein
MTALQGTTVEFNFMANGIHSVGEMIDTTKKSGNKFPEDLEAEIKALETPKGFRGEAEVEMLANERDHWKVQLTFAKYWKLTLTIKKEGINDEDVSVKFCDPCSYKGYPLLVKNDTVWFPAFCQSDVGWDRVEFPDSGDNRQWISIDLTDKDNNVIGLFQVSLDKLFTALASSEVDKRAETTNEAETAEAETKPLLVDPIDGLNAMRYLEHFSPFPPEEKIYRLDLVMEHLLKSPLLTAVHCNNLTSHINHSSVYTREQKEVRNDKVLKTLLGVRIREASADDEPSSKRRRRNM